MAGTSNYNFSYNNPYGMSKPQGQAFDPMSGGKPGGAPTGKMFGSSPSDQVSWDNPGLPQKAPMSTLSMGFSGSKPAVPPTPSPAPLSQGGSFVAPQFQQGINQQFQQGINQQFQQGINQQSGYGRQLNRFMGAGGNFDQFKPRMGAVGPAYRNGMSARPFTPPPPAYKPPDENIGLPPQPVESTSYVQPNFGGGFQ